MINLNQVVIEGNLARDPEIRTFQNGGSVANFTVACNDDYKPRDAQEWVNRCYFISVSAGGYAATSAERLAKGDRVIVQGKITTRTYEKDGRTVYVTEVKADRIMNRTPKDRQFGSAEYSPIEAGGYQEPQPQQWGPFPDGDEADIPF